eukprot:CAMPEP_0175067502 /NCGR_PEP_ID=MMETSP0052_2-20121109/17138_1 /TAXON_ID=51329 ORGANISM="Polytomella parva, Strain SAG 63-3" /NCGR_SAMPLE_ID=MMETSP0052_2 /ASSEMBLY_ACC=CAM_ASM_000194 /LENGTH=60 /DNA_ID=CAMNT_0016334399 /DNA_START=912 /DNA_END=1094 /DNA_ORIENTATION=+
MEVEEPFAAMDEPSNPPGARGILPAPTMLEDELGRLKDRLIFLGLELALIIPFAPCMFGA